MKLKCARCDHIWVTRKDRVPVQCSYCKTSTYYHKPYVFKE